MKELCLYAIMVSLVFFGAMIYMQLDDINKHLVNIEKSTSALDVLRIIPGVGQDGRQP